MLVVFVAFSVSGLSLGVLAAKPGFSDQAPCRDVDLNKCGSDFLIFSTSPQLPLQSEAQKDACRKEIESAECTRQFADKCSKGVVRGVNLLSMQNVVDEIEGKCAVGSPSHVQYLQHAPCLNKAGQEIQTCVVKYLEDIHSIAEFTPKKDKSAYNCCRHYIFEDCARKAINVKCKNAAARKYFDGILEQTMGELVGFACRRFQRSSDKCAKEFPRQKLAKVDTKGQLVNLMVPLTTIIQTAVI